MKIKKQNLDNNMQDIRLSNIRQEYTGYFASEYRNLGVYIHRLLKGRTNNR